MKKIISPAVSGRLFTFQCGLKRSNNFIDLFIFISSQVDFSTLLTSGMVTLKSESGTEIKRKWKQEMVKSGEAVLVEKFVSMGEIPENAMLSFQIQMLM